MSLKFSLVSSGKCGQDVLMNHVEITDTTGNFQAGLKPLTVILLGWAHSAIRESQDTIGSSREVGLFLCYVELL